MIFMCLGRYFVFSIIFNDKPSVLQILSSGQSSWLQIRSPEFDSQHYHKKVVGLERGPLSLMRTEKLLDREVAAPV
jgi:hypothetical protein